MAINNEGLVDIDKPLGLDAKFASLGGSLQPIKDINVGVVNPEKQLQPATLSEDVLKNIFNSGMDAANRKKSDPRESKFVDKSLTERYIGRNISYSDIGLDQTKVDAKYSKTQSIFETSINNLKVGAANGGAMFAAGFIGLADIIGNIANDRNATDSPIMESLFKFREDVAKNNIIFQNEQDLKTDAWSTIKNVVLPSYISGSTAGWGSIFENAMFGVGAGAGLAVQELAVTAATGGVGSLPVLARFVASSLNNLDKIRKTLSIADKIYDTSRSFNNIRTALDVTNKITTGAKWGYRMGIGAHGEAAFEGLETKHQLGETLKRDYLDKNGYNPSGKDLETINKIVDESGQQRYLANLALLGVSNGIGMQRLFRNLDLAKNTAEQLSKQGLKIGLNSEGRAIAQATNEVSSWWDKGFRSKIKPAAQLVKGAVKSDILKESLTEGTEEFLQLGIDNSINEYSKWRLNHGGQKSINAGIKAIQEGLGNSFNTDGLGAWISGAISGVAQQAAFSLPNVRGQIELSAKRKEELQSTISRYDGFNINNAFQAFNVNSVRGDLTNRALNANATGVADIAIDHAIKTNDTKLYKDAQSVSLFSLIQPYAERGHSDILKQQFDFSLEELSDEQVSELFGANISNSQARVKFAEEVDKVNNSYSKIKQAFKNPFKPQQVEDEFSPYTVFERDFVSELAFLDYRLNDLNKRKEDIQSTLGDYFEEFKYFSNQTDLLKGRKYIESQIKEIKESAEFLKSLPDNTVDDVAEYRKEFQLVSQYQNSLEALDKYNSDKTEENYNDFLDIYQEAMVTKLDRNDVGFINKNEVMDKLNDFNRIDEDLNKTEKILRGYLSKDGFTVFATGLASYSSNQQRKRDLFERTEETNSISTLLKEKHPDLSEEEIEEIISKSVSPENALEKAEKFIKDKSDKAEKELKARVDITEKFIKAGKGDLVNDYLDQGDLDLKNADQYLKDLNDEDLKLKKHEVVTSLVDNLKEYGEFITDNILKSLDAVDYSTQNKAIYDSLSTDGKLDVVKKVIKALEETKKLSTAQMGAMYNPTIKKYNDELLRLSIEKKTAEITPEEVEEQQGEELDNLEEQKVDEAEFEEIFNLENKFEGRYFNPEWFDSDGNVVGKTVDTSSFEELNNIFLNKSQKEIDELIRENIDVRFYDGDKLNGKNIVSILPQEKILTSLTTDAIVLSYKLPSGNLVPLNTKKSFIKGLGVLSGDRLKKVLATRIKDAGQIKKVVDFIGEDNYFEFIKKSIKNPEVYNILSKEGFLKFKGTPQQQLDVLLEKDRIFNKLKEYEGDKFKLSTLDFKRLFYVIQYENQSLQDIKNVKNPFASLKGNGNTPYTYYSFFRLKENFKEGSKSDIEILDLPDNLHKEVEEKVSESLTAQHRNKPDKETYAGYFMLITDSKGMPSVYSLSNKAVDPKDFLNAFNNVGSNDKGLFGVSIIGNTDRFDIKTKKVNNKLTVMVRDLSTAQDKFEGNSISIPGIDVNSTTVELLNKTILDRLKNGNWYDVNNNVVKTDVGNLQLKMVDATATKPRTVDEFLSTRQVMINPNNFTIDKLVVSERKNSVISEPSLKVDENDAISFNDLFDSVVSEEILKEEVIDDRVEKLNLILSSETTYPKSISAEDIIEFSDKISTLASISQDVATKFILSALSAYKTNVKNVDFYFNEGFDKNIISKISTKSEQAVSNAFLNKNVGDLFTDRSIPKTNVNNNFESKVQELIKQCL